MAGIQSASFVRFLRRAMVDVRIGSQCGKVKLLDEDVTIPAGVAGKGRDGSGGGVVILSSLFQVMAETGNHHGGTTKTENTATADDK